MKYLEKYAAFVAHSDTTQSTQSPIGHSILPPSFGGRRTLDNTVYLDARAALHACGLLWKMAPNDRVRRRYARHLLARLNAPEMKSLGGRAAWLLRATRPFVVGDASANTAPKTATLWHIDGRTASGSQPVLADATGMDPRRVRDLICGRRAYANGWATSKEAAAGGRRKRGRPPVEKEFWAS